MSGSTPKALEILESILKLKGKVLPSTTELVDLVIEYENGFKIIGQDKTNFGGISGLKIRQALLSPQATIYNKTASVIKSADVIIISPGDLFGSIIPNFLVSGMHEALAKSQAKIIYVLNLMTRFTQTHGYKASDHLLEIKRYSGIIPDYLVINNQAIPDNILKTYEKEHEYPVENDLTEKEFKLIIKPMIKIFDIQEKSDDIKRSLLRHDSNKLAAVIMSIID